MQMRSWQANLGSFPKCSSPSPLELQATSSSIQTPSAAVLPAPSEESSRPVPPPGHSLFSPPSEDEIRTIYVPLENAVNVPEQYTLDIGTSFGYKEKKEVRALDYIKSWRLK